MSTHTSETQVSSAALLPLAPDERPSPATLILNFFPCVLTAERVTVWSGRYPGETAAETLRQRTPGLVTWRLPEDASRMYAWHPTAVLQAGLLGLSEVTVSFEESPQLFERMIQDAVCARLRAIGFQPRGWGWVNYSRPSLLAEVPALASAASDRIGIYPKILEDVFFTKNTEDKLVIGLVVNVLYATRLDVTAAEWVAAGLADVVRGSYVNLVRGTLEAERFPEHAGRCIGRIDGIRGDRCVLNDPREPALVDVPLSAVAPEPTRTNLALYLGARYAQAYERGERALTERLRELVRPKSRHRLAEGLVLKRLQSGDTKDGLQIVPGVRVRFEPMIGIGAKTFPVRKLSDPEYSFDRAGGKYARRVDVGLQKHGPYDQVVMRRKQPRLLVVAPEENKGEVQLAVQKLLNGVHTKDNVFSGLKRMYRLEDLRVTYAWASIDRGPAMKRYAEAVNRAIREAPGPSMGEPHFHMVLTVIQDAHRSLPDSENPYFQTKALALVNEHVPTQAITIEKLRQNDVNLQYILNTLALACYAKLGGTSHVLKLPDAEANAADDPGPTTELIFGVGRHSRRDRRFGGAEETIGFATVFRANGEYLFNDCTPYCDDESYERALEETVLRTVHRAAAYEQLQDGAPLRLIFHVPRKPGKREERAILNAVGKLPQFAIEFALVHLNDDHNLQLFDTANVRPRGRRGQSKPEATFLPGRGLAVVLGPRERLLTFIGVDQYRGHGSPTPLRVTLDRRSTFKDVDHLTKQLYWLSFMSVRSLNPGVAPVTIIYAERLAYLTGHLRGVQQWTVELIHQHLGPKLWFI